MSHPTLAADEPRDPYAALRVPAYRRYLIGNTLAHIGRQGLGLVATWQIYRWTESATALGLVGLVNFLPYIVLALPAGHLADRVNRRRLIQVTLSVSALFSVLLAVVSAWPERVPDWAVLRWFNEGLLWVARLGTEAEQVGAAGFERPALAAVFLLLLLDQTIRTLGTPARASIVPLILPRKLIASAITWNSSSFELTAMLGPTLAGFLIAWLGFSAVYLLDAVLAFAMVGLLQGVTYREPELKPEPRTWRTLGAGAGFIWRNKEILAASGLDRKQHVYSQLLQVARNKGYSPGWVAHKYKAMFDVWPRNMRDVPATPTAELLNWLRSQQIASAKAREKQQEGRSHV